MKRWTVLLALLAAAHGYPSSAQTEQVRFGNLHAHTSYSDGLGKPADAFKMACDAGLDFFAVTEHNHAAADGKGERKDGIVIATSPQLYKGAAASLITQADQLDKPGQCVTIYGQEFSTISSGNHVNVFDVDEVIDVPNGQFDKLLEWLSTHRDEDGNPAVLQFNHPNSGQDAVRDYGRDDFNGGDEVAWLEAMTPATSLIEIFNAPALSPGEHQRTHDRSYLYLRYLNLGFHLAPSVGQDNHYKNWGVSTDARVAVITADFTRRGILQALRARHAYASEDKNLRIIFRSGDALQGDITDPPALGEELPLTLQIFDDDEPNASYRVDVLKDVAGGKPASSPVETFEFKGNQVVPVGLEGIRLEAMGEYVLLKITQFGEEASDDNEHPIDDRAWTAPIWFEPSGFHAEHAGETAIRITRMLPNPLGDDLTGERITFVNSGGGQVSLIGWQVRDLAGNIWELDGLSQIGPGQEKTLLRNGQPMSLNNNGDRIELVAPDGTVVQVVSYGEVSEGELVTAPSP